MEKINNQIVCFSKGTKVLLSNKMEKEIEKINLGDEILSFNTELNIIENVIVEKIAKSYHAIANIILFSNGTSLISTLDHPYFVVNKGWASVNPKMSNENYNLCVQKLEKGDICLSYINEKIRQVGIESINTVFDEQEMYVISGGKNNSFFANRIVVSDENLMAINFNQQTIK